jgi:hypothetical protein
MEPTLLLSWVAHERVMKMTIMMVMLVGLAFSTGPPLGRIR